MPPPFEMDDKKLHLRKLSEAARSLFDGKINTVGTVTLTANADSTTISHLSIGRDTLVVMFPTTANASADWAAGTFYQTYPNATKKQAVINHDNNANASRDFVYALLG